MVSSKLISDYPNLENPGRLQGISPENATHLKRWVAHCRMEGVSLNAINTNLYRILSWMRVMGMKDATNWTLTDIQEAYLAKDDEVASGNMRGTTLDGEIIVLKKFLRWLHPDILEHLTLKRKQTVLYWTLDDIIDETDIRKMCNVARAEGNLRFIALAMIIYGTGARVSEILDADISDVKFNRTDGSIRLRGKTGERQATFVAGMAELERWINVHPCRLPNGQVDSGAPLFVTYDTRGHSNNRLNRKTVGAEFSEYKAKAGISSEKKANPHAIRHLSITRDAEVLNHVELCLRHGWSPKSQMPLRYVHTHEVAVKNKILGLYGVESPEEPELQSMAIQCPRCSKIMATDDMYCSICGHSFDPSIQKHSDKIRYQSQKGSNLQVTYAHKPPKNI